LGLPANREFDATVEAMIEIPVGTRVYGMQLPIQTHTRTFVADWELSATPDDLVRVAQTADEHGFFYVAVCDHIAIPESLAGTIGTYWQDCVATLSWLAALTERTNLLSHAYVLPYRHPLVAAKAFETLDHLSGGRAIVGVGAGHVEAEFAALGVDHARRGQLLEEKLPVLIDALEHEFVGGVGAQPRPVQSPRPPVWIAGSTPAAIRRAAALGDGWLPQGPSNAEMVARLQTMRAEQGRADRPMMIGHITPSLYVGTPSWDVGPDALTGPPGDVAEQILAGTAEGVNQLQVRFRARSCEEQCDQMAAFAAEVAPILVTI
jgi:alkanesulfonate monooxygenase SsuD/methylene tetrahydromethanopterin reductase-like flavin-dependent oxidoreductase (luciferase family)